MTHRIRSLIATGLLTAAALVQAQTAAPTVQTGWARPTVAGQAGGGGYISIKGAAGADRLLSASSPVAKAVELHTMAMDGTVMRMRQIPSIEVPAGETVALKPGGNHLMFIGLERPLKLGDTFPLTLRFEKAGEVQAEMTVSMQAPGSSAAAPAHDHKH